MKYLVNKFTFLVIFIGFLFHSCESFIDLSPRDKIGMNSYWKTTADLKNYMLQFYPQFYPYSNMVSELEINSDDIARDVPSNIMNGELTLATGNWRGEWTNIRNLNYFFENYEKVTNNFNEYKHYVGEAHFFRAWFYFELLKKYGAIPYYSSVIQLDDEDKLTQPREPQNIVADKILEDLDNAIKYLDDRKTAGNLKINKEVALAFKTRVALYEGTWQKYHKGTAFGSEGANPNKYFEACVSAAEELMSGKYTVGLYNTGDPDKDYYNLFGFEDMSNINEVLLYKTFNISEGFGNTVEAYLSWHPSGKGATWDLVSSYLGKDGKPYNYPEVSKTSKGNDFLTKIANDCDPRLKSTIYIPGDFKRVDDNTIFDKPVIDGAALELVITGFQIKKSTNPYSFGAARSWQTGSNTGLIIFRYGEVLVNYAEAKYELSNTVAYDQLNLLRERAGMPDFVVNPQISDPNLVNYGYTISDGLYEIRRERRVELALEGIRKDDYRRWRAHSLFKGKRPMGYPVSLEEFPDYPNPIAENGLIDYYTKSLPNGYQFRENQDYLYSIPQEEITLNPNLTQNPGW